MLIVTLLAAITTVMAAPPRFSGFTLESREQESQTPTPSDADAAKAKQSSSGSLNEDQPAQAKQELPATGKEGLAVDTTQSAAKAQSKQATSTSPPPKKKREPLIRWPFSRKQAADQEKTYKKPEELVNTTDHHMGISEELGIADLHRYAPPQQEFWKVDSSKALCSMKQTIANYGYVEFRQGVGQHLEFALFVANPPAGVGVVHVRAEPPEWQHYAHAKDLGKIEVEHGKRAVTASEDWSRRLFLEMSEGMRPVLRYWDAADGSDDIEVMLSALNFQTSIDMFNRCLGQLLRYDFEGVKRAIVHFHEDSSRLRAKAKQQLDDMMEVLNEDTGVKQIDLEMYTRSKGLVRYNFRLATRRARAVRDYLIERGIDEDKLLIKIHTKSNKDLAKLGFKTSDVHVVLRRKVAK
jgi:outer membrane protein OmpA-like peptidoglycan-associated protein